MEIPVNESDFNTHAKADRFGIFASILCAVHCALTPVLLIMLPTFGKAWAHPSTHWGMAIIVIPLALLMMRKGYMLHGKKWLIYTGSIGITFIVVGAILPYIDLGKVDLAEKVTVSEPAPKRPAVAEAASPG